MIQYLKGIILNRQNDTVVLVVQGIGFHVHVPTNILIAGDEVELHVYMHWSQENGPALFGFAHAAQRDLFCMLISVSGIGPRMALALIDGFSVQVLIDALISGNIALLSSVNGIGRKKAEMLVLHLKEKAEKITALTPRESLQGLAAHAKDLSDALISLGYSRPEIAYVCEQLRSVENLATLNFDSMLRKALQMLAKTL